MANRTGTTLELEVIPHRTRARIVYPGEPCDIVAKEDGVIVSVTALEGIAKGAGRTNDKKRVIMLISGNIIREEGEKPHRTGPWRGYRRSTSRAAILFL